MRFKIEGDVRNLLSEKITKLRKGRNLTQQQVAKSLELTRSAYSQYELGTRNPDHDILNKIADFYDVSIDYLLGRTENPEQVLSEPSRVLIDSLDLTDEEIMNKMDFSVDGIKLDDEDVRRFIALVRAERSMKKQVPAVQGAKEDKL
ncbi:helix-turn-helix transcriptional regulator [Paenibacillus sp. FSL R7-0210]|uniref:helix-turn-helix domain-containing protein n=1 Tax=Paenibacillus sp. FSL R7-0210 TaxID=2921676 RepID=UPI0030F68330